MLVEVDILKELQDRGIEGQVTSGGNYKAVCPFHEDNSPSFVVSLYARGEKPAGLYFCNGCQAGGGFIKLISFLDGTSLRQAEKGLVGDVDEGVLEKYFYSLLETKKKKIDKRKKSFSKKLQ